MNPYALARIALLAMSSFLTIAGFALIIRYVMAW